MTISRMTIGVARGNVGPKKIQNWQSIKKRRLQGLIPYVLLELLLNEKR